MAGRCALCVTSVVCSLCTPAVGMRALCARETMTLVKAGGKDLRGNETHKDQQGTRGCREGRRVVYTVTHQHITLGVTCQMSRSSRVFPTSAESGQRRAQRANISRCDTQTTGPGSHLGKPQNRCAVKPAPPLYECESAPTRDALISKPQNVYGAVLTSRTSSDPLDGASQKPRRRHLQRRRREEGDLLLVHVDVRDVHIASDASP